MDKAGKLKQVISGDDSPSPPIDSFGKKVIVDEVDWKANGNRERNARRTNQRRKVREGNEAVETDLNEVSSTTFNLYV